MIIVGAIIRPGVFLTSDNLLNVLTQASITGIIAIGMTFVIATGGIDLSVGSVLAAACIAGGLLAEYGSWMFMLGALGMALLLGSINGLAITWGKVVPFIATLAMLIIARGLALWMSEKTPINLIELDILQSFGSGRVLGVPCPPWSSLPSQSLAGCCSTAPPSVDAQSPSAATAARRESRAFAPDGSIFAVYVLTGLCVGISALTACLRADWPAHPRLSGP